MECLQERPGIALPEEAARMRDAEARRRLVLEPGEVVEVASVCDHADAAACSEPSNLVRDRLRDARDRIRVARNQARDLLVRGLTRARRGRVVAPVLVRHERIPEVGDPAGSRRALNRRADEVHRARWGGRDHDVDALALRDPDRRRDGGEIPRHARIGDEQATSRDLRLDERALEPVRGTKLLRRLAPARADVARAVDPCLRRHAQLGIPVHPLRVVGREHVRLDTQRGKVLRELERPLDAASSRRGEVHRHEQDLHGREG